MRQYVLKFMSEDVKRFSSGEILEPKFFNSKSQLPVVNGLLCPRIFGPEDEYTCLCSKVKKGHMKGQTCSKCGMTFLPSSERRTRVGHIKLVLPVLHPLAVGILSDILHMSASELEKVILGEVRLNVSSDPKGMIFVWGEPHRVYTSLKKSQEKNVYRGGKELYDFIKFIDIYKTLDRNVEKSLSLQEENTTVTKNILFLKKCIAKNFTLKDLFIYNLPVLPPDLRPLLISGRKVIMDYKNDIYMTLLWRRNRLAYINDPKWLKFPAFVQKDILQAEAVTYQYELFKHLVHEYIEYYSIPGIEKNSGEKDPKILRRTLPKDSGKKSFIDGLMGKWGRMRGYMLGKRVDYSGRTVITPGPHLSINEMGLPRYMALRLFKPWILGYMVDKKHFTLRRANRYYKNNYKDLYNDLLREVVDEVVKDKVVILNRQPSLHRLSMFCFNIRIHDGKSMFLHPMVCAPFNADFDGDQMAVHVPISIETLAEAKKLMYPVDNLISPADGSPVIAPSHEMVIGAYDMTIIKEGKSPYVCLSKERAIEEYDRERIRINDPVEIRTPARCGGGVHLTNVGRILLGNLFGVPITEPLTKSSLKKLISASFDVIGKERLVVALDGLKELAYKHVSRLGFSLGIDDFIVPSTRQNKMEEAQAYADQLAQDAKDGKISEEERVENKIRKWMDTIESIQKDFFKEAGDANPIVIMLRTGARVSMTQVSQLVVAKGMQAKSGGGIIEDPIKNCTRTKLNTFEFFVSCYGARKSMADKKMATPLSGYLARRLVNAARDLYISEYDCGYYGEGVEIERRYAVGRTLLTGEVVEKNNSKDLVVVRSPVFCHGRKGICSKCYGLDLSKRKPVKLGTPVGVIAAQSLTEPCTQLTMRTFHTSGAAELKDSPLVIRSATDGAVFIRRNEGNIVSIAVGDSEYMVHEGLCRILVHNSQKVTKGTPLAVYTSKNLANEDIGGKLFLLESYYEAKKPKFHAAVIAKDAGPVELRVEEETFDNETYHVIAVYINGEKQGTVKEVPVFVHDGEIVRKGQFLSYGEAYLRKYEGDLSCAANAFVQRVAFLYDQEGLSPASTHIEMIFRSMTEFVDVQDEEFGLFREGAQGKRKLMGVTNIGINYPSWLKAIGFGYVKEGLLRGVSSFSVSKSLPSERILTGEYPLFEPVEQEKDEDAEIDR